MNVSGAIVNIVLLFVVGTLKGEKKRKIEFNH